MDTTLGACGGPSKTRQCVVDSWCTGQCGPQDGSLPAEPVDGLVALDPCDLHPVLCSVTVHCLASFGEPVGSGSIGSHEGDGPAAMQTDEAAAAGAASAGAAADDAESGGCSSGSSGVYALDEAAVCLHFARSLLASQPDWELFDFEEAWQRAVPEVSRAVEPAAGRTCACSLGSSPAPSQASRDLL